MAETTDYMERLGVTPALFKKWQAEDDEADEPAPFQTQHDTVILAQRGRAARREAVRPSIMEHVMVEGRLVGHAPVGVDIAFKEVTIEVTETAEVPVVSKEARVVEEVIVGKTVTDRVETISTTLRRTDVEVEQTGERERARSH